MNTAQKRTAALAALDNHARRYKVSIPDRVKNFFAGDFDRYHLTYVKAKVASWGSSAFQLALTPPTWLNKGDDAVNGPRGDWDGAKNYVPLFVTDQGLYVVVDLAHPECRTGWYHEEEHCSDGPERGASSLDAFLASLTKDAPGGDVNRPADPEQELDWAESFADDGPRTFDLADDD